MPTGNGRISVYHAADLSTFPLRPTCFPRYFLHLGYDWSLCLAPSLPPFGVTSMSFRPGCHRPFHRSYCLRSLPLLSQDCVLSSFGSVSFASAIPRHCASAFPHFNRRHSSTLRPVFIQLAHTVISGRRGIRTPDVLRFHRHLLRCFIHSGELFPYRGLRHDCLRPLSHPPFSVTPGCQPAHTPAPAPTVQRCHTPHTACG